MMVESFQFDRIGAWSELKLEIVKKYAVAYSKILAASTKAQLYHVYIDAFAGAGEHLSKTTGVVVPGSPLNALAVEPKFREYHLIDLSPEKIENLREAVGQRNDVSIYQGDCNEILLKQVFPHVKYSDYRRGLCLLDPYGLHLNWEVIATAGRMKSLDVFLNFPIQDINRNALRHDPEGVDESQIRRMSAYWGDDSWKVIGYDTTRDLFGNPEKESNEVVAQAFRGRLKSVAGFAEVPEPLPMKNSKGATVYYLFFASQNRTAARIAHDIFAKYRGQRS